MALRPHEDCAAAVKGAYEPDYARSLQTCRDAILGNDAGFGTGLNEPGPFGADSVWPHVKDYLSTETIEGRPRRLLVNSVANLGKNRSSLVLPRYPGAPTQVESARRSYFEELATDQDWDGMFDSFAWSLKELGVGVIRIGIADEGDEQYLVAESISALHVLWDPRKKDPRQSDWVGFSLILSVEEARVRFGKKAADDATQGQDGAKYVRLVEYWDRGVPGYEPTLCTWLSDPVGKPVEHEANPYGVIPMAAGTLHTPDGSPRPIGSVSLQLSTESRRLVLEQLVRDTAEQNPSTGIDISMVDSKLAAQMAKSKMPARFLYDSSKIEGNRPPLFQIPPTALNPTLYQELTTLREQQDAEASTNDYERGVIASGQRTAREVAEIASAAERQGGLMTKKLAKGFQMFYIVAGRIAAAFDTRPIMVDVEGVDVTLNDPAEPEMSLAEAFKDASRVTIEEESLSAGGVMRKTLERVASLKELIPFAGPAGSGAPLDIEKVVMKIATLLVGTEAGDLKAEPPPMLPMPGMMPGALSSGQVPGPLALPVAGPPALGM